MSSYDSKLCDILNDINNVVKNTSSLNKEQSKEQIEATNKIGDYIKNNNIKNYPGLMSILNKFKNDIKPIDETQEYSELYNKLVLLSNEIQNDTISTYNYYSKNTNTLLSEQNKEFENFKFNKIYLFFFNFGIIFIILRNAYFKKTY